MQSTHSDSRSMGSSSVTFKDADAHSDDEEQELNFTKLFRSLKNEGTKLEKPAKSHPVLSSSSSPSPTHKKSANTATGKSSPTHKNRLPAIAGAAPKANKKPPAPVTKSANPPSLRNAHGAANPPSLSSSTSGSAGRMLTALPRHPGGSAGRMLTALPRHPKPEAHQTTHAHSIHPAVTVVDALMGPNYLPAEILHQQVKELKQKNFQLVRNLEQRSVEVHDLQRVLAENTSDKAVEHAIAESFQGAAASEDIREQKLMELAKKSRRLYVALETERTKNAQLAARIKSMEHAAYKSSTPSNPSVPNDIEESAVKTELKQLKDKIALLTRRVEEERSQKMMLKTELRQTQTALQLELGEFQPIRNVLESKGTWRGRAQQIANLKTKLEEVTWQLKQATNTENHTTVDADGRSMSQHSLAQTAGGHSIAASDHSRRSTMVSIRGQREQLEKEIDLIKSEKDALQRKFDSMRMRNDLLERQAKETRVKMISLVEKTSVDDQLIDALRKELGKKEENYVCDIQGELDRKEEKIQQLESTIKQISMSPKPSRTASAASSSVMGDRSSGAALQVMRSRNDGLMALNRSLEQRLQECEDDRNFLAIELKKAKHAASQHPHLSTRTAPPLQEAEDLRTRVEIQQDEIAALKAHIQQLLQRKQEEATHYNQMLEKTQLILLEAGGGSNGGGASSQR